MADVILISGSASALSRSSGLIAHAQNAIAARGHAAEIVSLKDLPAEDLLYARYDSAAFAEAKQKVEAARAVVIATPVYKAAYTALLKAFLDILPQYGLRGKTVLPIASGGSQAHLLMIDYSLKPLLSVMGATDLLSGIYAVDEQVKVAPSGEVWLHDDLRERIDRGLDALCARLGKAT